MIVLEPAPPAPRRATSKADAGDAPDPEKAGSFDALVAAPEGKEAAEDVATDAAMLVAMTTPPASPTPDPTAVAAAAERTAPATTVPVVAVAETAAAVVPVAAPTAAALPVVPAERAGPPAPAGKAALATIPPAAPADETTDGAAGPADAVADFDVHRSPAAPTGAVPPPVTLRAPDATAANTPLPPAAPGAAETAPRPDAPEAEATPRVLVRLGTATPAPEAAAAAATVQPGALDAMAAAAPAGATASVPAHGRSAVHAAADPQAVASQIATAMATSPHHDRLEIRLDPPELGRVHIHLTTTTDGGVQAVVAAQRPETQDLLRRHADTLAQELAAAGYGDVSLDFAAGNGTAPERDERTAPDWHAVALAAIDVPASAPAPRPGAAGALDIRL